MYITWIWGKIVQQNPFTGGLDNTTNPVICLVSFDSMLIKEILHNTSLSALHVV